MRTQRGTSRARESRAAFDSTSGLPLRALYRLTDLAEAVSMDRRTLRGVLQRAAVRVFKTGRSFWVPLSELEVKVPPLWESIKAAELLRHLVEDEP